MGNTRDKDPNSAQRRLVRIETRLSNFGRYMGIDLTKPPAPNEPAQPVFIADGAVFCTSTATVGEITLAVLRYQDWQPSDREVPVIINGQTVAVMDAWEYTKKEGSNGQDHRQEPA